MEGGAPVGTVWTYGLDDHIAELPADEIKAFKPTGHFRLDFVDLCKRCGIAPHVAFLPPRAVASEVSEPDVAESPAENPNAKLTLSVQSTFLDRAALQVARHLLTTTTDVKVLRINGCRLDVEALTILRGGLSDGCPVATLQIDWNPLEVPHEDTAELRRRSAEGALEEIDTLEHLRVLRQVERTLRDLGDRLELRCGPLGAVLSRIVEVAQPEHPSTGVFAPLDRLAFVRALDEGSGGYLHGVEADNVFDILDGPLYGSGDGLVPLMRLKDAIESARNAPHAQDEEKDPLGLSFGALMDGTSTVEVVSLRHCNIGRVECQAIAKALGSPPPHLRAVNLWGNNVCDRGATALGRALETNFSLQYLGLGRNLVTHVGLQHLCKALGVSRLTEKTEAEHVMKALKDQLKEKEKKMKNPPPPKRDASGRERYTPEVYVPSCEEHKDPDSNKNYWLWTRNVALKTLVLDQNPIADAEAVMQLQPYGCGDLALRGVPCVQELAELMEPPVPVEAEAVPVEDGRASTSPTPSRFGPPFKGAAAVVTGWRIILH